MRTGVLVVLLSAATIVTSQVAAAAPTAPAEVRLVRVSVKGNIQRGAARQELRQRLGVATSCAARHLKLGRSRLVTATLTVAGGKVTAVTIAGAGAARLRRCLQHALKGYAGHSSHSGTITAKLKLVHGSKAARAAAAQRRAKLARAIATMGALKMLGTRGSVGGTMYSGRDAFRGVGGITTGPAGLGTAYNRRRRERRAKARAARAKRRKQLLARALRVPKVRHRPATWPRPELSSHSSAWFPLRRRTVAMSKQAAIVSATLDYLPAKGETKRSATLYLAVHRTRGVVGLVTPPKNVALWDVDLRGAVRVVTRSGQLHHARSLNAATRPAGWTPLARFDGATWDLAPGLIVAAKERTIHVSTDGGKTFTRTNPPAGSKLLQVAARFDGVIVARSSDDTFISSDKGRSWARSSFQPDRLSRRGAWIYARTACHKVTLSVDKRTWVKRDPPQVLGRYSARGGQSRSRRKMTGWEALVDTAERPLAYAPGRHPSPSDPPPPALTRSSEKVTGKPQPCKRGGGGVGIGGLGLRGGAPGGGCGYGARGKGFLAQCVRGTIGRVPKVSTLWVGWLTDGMTGRATRPPTLAFADHRQGKLSLAAPLPPSCTQPRRVRSVHGTAVLICEEAGKSRLYLAAPGGTWHQEVLLDSPADQLRWVTGAPDGTLLIQRCHYDRERKKKEGSGYLCSTAHVRRPVKLGSTGAWRQVRVSDALTYRPLSGGRALVVDRVGAGNTAIALLIDDPRRTRTLARKIELTRDLQNLYVEQGRIVVKLGRGHGEHVLTRSLTFEKLPARY